MRTESVCRFSEVTTIKGEVLPGEYPDRCITRDQEITVLEGTVSCRQQGSSKPVCFSKGEKFKLFEGRTYTFRFDEPFVFSCTFC